MPVTPTYPGVYIEEIPSGVVTITGVSTSVTAFLGYTPKGPVNSAVHIYNYSDYVRNFGDLSKDSELGYAVQQFFLNGGSEAWVVRVAVGASSAGLTLCSPGASPVLDLTASSAGTWGNYLKVDVDYITTNPDGSFNLTVTEYIPQGAQLIQGRQEVFQNLSMDSKSSQYAPNVINGSSRLIVASRNSAVNAMLGSLAAGWSLSTDVSGVQFPMTSITPNTIAITVDGQGPYEIQVFPTGSAPADLNQLVSDLQKAIQTSPANPAVLSGVTVTRANSDCTLNKSNGKFILFTSGTPVTALEQSSVCLANASSSNLSKLLGLGLSNHGREGGGAAGLRPAVNGTLGKEISTLSAISSADKLTMAIADGTTSLGTLNNVVLGSTPGSLIELASLLQKAIRLAAAKDMQLAGNIAFTMATVRVIGNRLQVVSGTDKADALVSLSGNLATNALLTSGAEKNVQHYSLGVGTTIADQAGAFTGNNGTPPTAMELIGNPASKTGMYALENVDLFNLLCIPRVATLDKNSGLAVISAAQAYCQARRAFYLIDPPAARQDPDSILEWTSLLQPGTNSAVYFPFVEVPDPLDGLRLNPFPPSGTMAGLYARIDSNRGFWKAPAGTEATLTNVQALAYNLTNAECGTLNQQGINCLRQLPVYGRVSWGARTTIGSNQQASEWKYIPVRRVALYLEESLYRGTQWVVFEPNDEPLWAHIRLNVGSFLQTLFRQGAFQGSSPREAYFVKCDRETTTQDDINRGVVNILVGFAPLKPAEFVIIQIQQMAGQTQA
jgi:uncharacterized protein